jgi:DNA polymerase/3'-5' exonuclease PolX
MKLNKRTLKKIIKEELEAVLDEVRTMPTSPAGLNPEQMDKIHSLIDAGEHSQAQSLIDAFGGDPSYVDQYIEYQQVGDIEKLGNKQRDLYASHGGSDSWEFLDHPFHDEVDAIQGQIEDLASDKAYDHLGGIIRGDQKSFDDHSRAYHMHRNRRGSLKVGPKK